MSRRHVVQRNAAVVALEGDVDLQSAPDVRKILQQAVGSGLGVVVDLSAVSYIDSSGIAALVEAYQRARQDDRRLILAAVSEPALRVLRLARLDRVFPICASVDEALNGNE